MVLPFRSIHGTSMFVLDEALGFFKEDFKSQAFIICRIRS